MKVYIVEQEWQTECEHESNIIEVYSTLEKAQLRLQKLYNEDLEWIQEYSHEEELDDDTLEENYSNVQYDIIWSTNTITEKELL